MECKLKNRHELISNYLMGELPDDEAKNFEEHYFQCETCFKELKIAEDAISLIRHEGPAILEPQTHQPMAETEDESSKHKNFGSIIQKFTFPGLSSPKRWGIAAAAIAVAITFLMIFTNRNDQEVFNNKITSRNKETPKAMDTLKESRQKPEQVKDFLAELSGPDFEPEPYLEEWITENIRSDSKMIDTVFSPLIGEKFYNKEIIFRWNMTNDNVVSLKILTNREEEVFNATADQTQFPLLKVRTGINAFKQSGLYYWRIEDENEVLFVGKFYFFK